MQPAMQPAGFPAFGGGCEVTFISLPQQLGKEHVCTRHCAYQQVMGNMYQCSTSGTVHVCDQNCNQRIYYDSYRTICRLSKKLFAASEAAMSDGPRKRPSEGGGCGDERLASQKRSLSEAEWAAQQAAVDVTTANAAWCAGEVAAWARVQH